jgi:hypothetical protein
MCGYGNSFLDGLALTNAWVQANLSGHVDGSAAPVVIVMTCR